MGDIEEVRKLPAGFLEKELGILDQLARKQEPMEDYGKLHVDFQKVTGVRSMTVDREKNQVGLSEAASALVKSAIIGVGGHGRRHAPHELAHLLGLRNDIARVYANGVMCLSDEATENYLKGVVPGATSAGRMSTSIYSERIAAIQGSVAGRTFIESQCEGTYINEPVSLIASAPAIAVAPSGWHLDACGTIKNTELPCPLVTAPSIADAELRALRLRQVREALAALLAAVFRLLRSMTTYIGLRIRLLCSAFAESFLSYCVKFRPWHTNHGTHPPDAPTSQALPFSA